MLAKLKQLYIRSSFIFPLLIAFLLPFGINYGPIIGLWLISFFVFDDVKSGMQKVATNKWSYIFITFFIIHAFGYFFSSNKAEALSSIEIKVPFIFLPFLLFTSNFNELQLKKIVISFVSGCLILAFICILRAIYLYYVMGINSFFYYKFTYFLHPSYFAMYFILAQLIVMLYYKTWLAHLNHLYLKIGFISLVFLVNIFLASSKMGLIAAFMILPVTLFVVLINNGYKKSVLIFLAGLLAFVGIAYKANVADVRESPSIEILKELRHRGAIVSWNDSVVNSWQNELSHEIKKGEFDVALILVNHSNLNVQKVISSATLVLDTTGTLLEIEQLI